MLRWLVLSGTHLAALAVGFALGIYLLPVLIAPEGPDKAEIAAAADTAEFRAEFTRELKGSDFLHWGEGAVAVAADKIVHEGKLAPGPDYKLYLTTKFVEDEAQFEAIKADAVRIGDIKTFNGFIIDVPPGADVAAYTTVVVWCETFSEFITAAKYR